MPSSALRIFRPDAATRTYADIVPDLLRVLLVARNVVAVACVVGGAWVQVGAKPTKARRRR